MKNQILDLYGILRAEYLHSHGRKSTERLIQELDCQPSERILEIGVGSGTTLTLLASNYQKTNFFGTDVSKMMLTTAQARLKFCGQTANTQLVIQDDASNYSFQGWLFRQDLCGVGSWNSGRRSLENYTERDFSTPHAKWVARHE